MPTVIPTEDRTQDVRDYKKLHKQDLNETLEALDDARKSQDTTQSPDISSGVADLGAGGLGLGNLVKNINNVLDETGAKDALVEAGIPAAIAGLGDMLGVTDRLKDGIAAIAEEAGKDKAFQYLASPGTGLIYRLDEFMRIALGVPTFMLGVAQLGTNTYRDVLIDIRNRYSEMLRAYMSILRLLGAGRRGTILDRQLARAKSALRRVRILTGRQLRMMDTKGYYSESAHRYISGSTQSAAQNICFNPRNAEVRRMIEMLKAIPGLVQIIVENATIVYAELTLEAKPLKWILEHFPTIDLSSFRSPLALLIYKSLNGFSSEVVAGIEDYQEGRKSWTGVQFNRIGWCAKALGYIAMLKTMDLELDAMRLHRRYQKGVECLERMKKLLKEKDDLGRYLEFITFPSKITVSLFQSDPNWVRSTEKRIRKHMAYIARERRSVNRLISITKIFQGWESFSVRLLTEVAKWFELDKLLTQLQRGNIDYLKTFSSRSPLKKLGASGVATSIAGSTRAWAASALFFSGALCEAVRAKKSSKTLHTVDDVEAAQHAMTLEADTRNRQYALDNSILDIEEAQKITKKELAETDRMAKDLENYLGKEGQYA